MRHENDQTKWFEEVPVDFQKNLQLGKYCRPLFHNDEQTALGDVSWWCNASTAWFFISAASKNLKTTDLT